MKTSMLNLIVSAAAVAMIAMPIPALAEATEAQIDRFVSMFDKLDTAKKGALDKKQVEALLNELMKSGA